MSEKLKIQIFVNPNSFLFRVWQWCPAKIADDNLDPRCDQTARRLSVVSTFNAHLLDFNLTGSRVLSNQLTIYICHIPAPLGFFITSANPYWKTTIILAWSVELNRWTSLFALMMGSQHDIQEFCLKWNNHHSTLVSVLDSLLVRESLVDVVLAAEGQSIKVHRLVLFACSQYFTVRKIFFFCILSILLFIFNFCINLGIAQSTDRKARRCVFERCCIQWPEIPSWLHVQVFHFVKYHVVCL